MIVKPEENTLLKRSGQAWKLNALFAALVFAGIVLVLAWLGRQSLDSGLRMLLLMAGAFIVPSALALACISIRCPGCDARWLWQAISTRDSGGWLAWLESRECCPACGGCAGETRQSLRKTE